MMGNHRDAWGFGALDPGSGTAQMMEVTKFLDEVIETFFLCSCWAKSFESKISVIKGCSSSWREGQKWLEAEEKHRLLELGSRGV